MKVLHVITGLEGGGAERMLLRLCTALRVHGIQSVVVSLIDPGPLGVAFAQAGIEVASLRVRRGSLDVRAMRNLVRIFRRERPDILQTWLYHSDLLGAFAHLIDFRRTPLVWNIRCGVFDTTRYSRTLTIVRRILVSLSRLPAAIVCNSTTARDEHIAIGYAPDRWRVIPNGIDTRRFVPSYEDRGELRRLFGIPENLRVVGIVGRIDPLKDYPTFLDAAVRVRSRFPDTCFAIAGEGLSFSNETFVSLIDERAIRDSVVLLGEVSDVSRLFPAFDVCCLSSSSESFPNVLAEAMACGVPCVSTDVGAAAEIVGREGTVVPPRDPEALASALIQMLELPESARVELGTRGRARIEVDYSLETITNRYAELYREIVAQRR